MRIALFVKNLIFADRIRSAALARGAEVVLSHFDSEWKTPPPELVFVDLAEPDWELFVHAAKQLPTAPAILGFGPHVRSDLFDSARKAGVNRSMANSKLTEDIGRILEEYAR